MNFEQLNIQKELKVAILQKGYEQLTDIQAQTIPLALEGKDILGQAQTGTGKTMAFSLPIINAMEQENKKIQALILVPTRELALQVCKEINSISKNMGIKAISIFGGESIEKQLKDLKNNPQIVVATPGRCIDLIDKNKIKVKNLKFFALDEVDEMLNMGFIDDVEYISSKLPKEKQTLLFSATMPEKIKKIANKYLIDPQIIRVKSKSIVADRVEQFYIKSKVKQKKLILKHLIDLNSRDKIIIFTQTKRSADEVSDFLISQNLMVGKIHGDLLQKARTATIQKFRDNHLKYLVATDVVARGIDIDDVALVINYELPQDIEYYIHRIGRTARGMNNTGKAITLVSPNIYDREFRHYSKNLKVNIKEMEIPTIDSVINILKDKVKETTLKLEDVDDKVYNNLANDLLEFENPKSLVAKLLKKLYPELSKEEHLKIANKHFDEPNTKRYDNKSKKNNRKPNNSNMKRGRNNGYNKTKNKSYKKKTNM